MGERQVRDVARVVEPVEIVARPELRCAEFEHALPFEVREAAQRRRLAVAEIREDQAEILLRRIRTQNDFARESRIFAGLFQARAVGAELPTVIAAADRVALHPAGRELRRAVRARKLGDAHRAGAAAVHGQLLVQDAHRIGPFSRDVLRPRYRVPKRPQVAAGERSGFGGVEISVRDLRARVNGHV